MDVSKGSGKVVVYRVQYIFLNTKAFFEFMKLTNITIFMPQYIVNSNEGKYSFSVYVWMSTVLSEYGAACVAPMCCMGVQRELGVQVASGLLMSTNLLP